MGACRAISRCWKCLRQNWEKKRVFSDSHSGWDPKCLQELPPKPHFHPAHWGDLQVALSTKEFPSFQLSCWLWSQAIRISCDFIKHFLSPYFKWSFLRKLFGIQSIFPPLRNVINGGELLSPNTLVLLIMECTNGRNNELPFITTFCFLILKKIICEFQFGLLALCCWP